MCGILAIIGNSSDALNRLKKLQHRGQESYGFITNTGQCHRELGKIEDHTLTGNVVMAHVRYSTTRVKHHLASCQPLISSDFAIIHNGNIPNYKEIAEKENLNLILETDSEIIVRIIEKYGLDKGMLWILENIERAFSIIIMYGNELYVIRDRYGNRPLYIGQNEDSYCIASESCCMQGYMVNSQTERGSIIRFTKNEYHIIAKVNNSMGFCSFEYIYYMSHQTIDVYNKRFEHGWLLGLDEISKADIVVCMPNTSIAAAEGFSFAVKLPFRKNWIRKHSSERTFILPENTMRIEASNKAYIISQDDLSGKRIFLIDDSIVRGNTLRGMTQKLYSIGVAEIHIRIASPPVVNICRWGIDIPSKDELYVNSSDKIKCDSIRYLDYSKVGRGCKECFELEW